MIKLGEKQKLVIVKKVEFGVYLAASKEEAEDRVLLPVKQVPEDAKVGDELEVFIYRDSKDRMIATTNSFVVYNDIIANSASTHPVIVIGTPV